MVPPTLISQIESAMQALGEVTLDTNHYRGQEVHGLVIDLMTAEAGYAGIATTLIDGARPPREYVAIVQAAIPLDGHQCRTREGDVIDLSDYPEIELYIRALERVRATSLRAILMHYQDAGGKPVQMAGAGW